MTWVLGLISDGLDQALRLGGQIRVPLQHFEHVALGIYEGAEVVGGRAGALLHFTHHLVEAADRVGVNLRHDCEYHTKYDAPRGG